MHIQTESILPVGFDPDGPTVRVARFTKAELATLTKAADLLETLRNTAWATEIEQDESRLDTDVALAMYTMRELVEEATARGRVEL